MMFKLKNCNKNLQFEKLMILHIFQILITTETSSTRVSLSEDTSTNNPEFIAPVENKTAALGREATFTCSVKNIGKYMVGWLRATDKMIISLHTRAVIQNERISIKYEPFHIPENHKFLTDYQGNEKSQYFDNTANGTWRLIIRQLKESDRGCYMCQINTSPMISQLGCLDILVSPDILNNETSTDISVKEGENTTLSCKATGRPTPRIIWKREDGKPILVKKIVHGNIQFFPVMIYNGSELSFYRVDRQQMGTYLCIASNDVHPAVSKRVTLSVNFVPKVQTLTQLLGAPFGTNVTLICNVEAHPNSVNYWYKETNIMLPNGPKYFIEEIRDGYKVTMRLTIKEFNKNDVGSYSCVSSNSLGSVDGSIRLYEISDFDKRGIIHESQHISILSGIAEAARGLGMKCVDFYNISTLLSIAILFI